MDKQVDQTLGTRPCETCGVDTYEANLTCHNCRSKWEPCAVSGYPVQVRKWLALAGGSGVFGSLSWSWGWAREGWTVHSVFQGLFVTPCSMR